MAEVDRMTDDGMKALLKGMAVACYIFVFGPPRPGNEFDNETEEYKDFSFNRMSHILRAINSSTTHRVVGVAEIERKDAEIARLREEVADFKRRFLATKDALEVWRRAMLTAAPKEVGHD